MRSDEYGRLHAAFLAMAEQADLPEVRARWFALAIESLIHAGKRPLRPSAQKHLQKHLKDRLELIRTRLNARALVGLYAAQDAATFLAESMSADSVALLLL